MRILISGACGFAGSTIAVRLKETVEGVRVLGFDNFMRPGSETNRARLKHWGIHVKHADARNAADVMGLPEADWVIDAAANPSVLAGTESATGSRQLLEHNLNGTINLLEYCKTHIAGFILLSTSRVYAVKPLAELKVKTTNKAFHPAAAKTWPEGLSRRGLSEEFSTTPPLSLYGATKLASELLALEYGSTFRFPVRINRCGVLGGAGQFGRPDQGLFSFWIHSWQQKRPLKYIGFGGKGFQVRDCLHPADLVSLLRAQMQAGMNAPQARVINVSGGLDHAMSLAQLSDWCRERFGPNPVHQSAAPRAFDVPWLVLNAGLAARAWNWRPETPLEEVLEGIARHAESHPEWLDVSAP